MATNVHTETIDIQHFTNLPPLNSLTTVTHSIHTHISIYTKLNQAPNPSFNEANIISKGEERLKKNIFGETPDHEVLFM